MHTPVDFLQAYALQRQAARNAIDAVQRRGEVRISPSVTLVNSRAMALRQAAWQPDDVYKDFDFTRAPCWLVSNQGHHPVPVRTPEDLAGAVLE